MDLDQELFTKSYTFVAKRQEVDGPGQFLKNANFVQTLGYYLLKLEEGYPAPACLGALFEVAFQVGIQYKIEQENRELEKLLKN